MKGQGRINKILSKKIANYRKRQFIKNHLELIDSICNENKEVRDITIIGFSGNKYFYEQIYSALSFIKNIGKPLQWIIINDGTYNKLQIETLEKIKGLRVENFDFIHSDTFEGFKQLSEEHIWGKIFYAYFNLLKNMTNTTIFIEADVLVFEGMKRYWPLFNKKNYYLADTDIHLDSNYFKKNLNPMLSVNNGFAVFNSVPDLQIAYTYMLDRMEEGTFEYFTPQSAFQLMIENDPDSKFLDPRYFIVSCSDHFKIDIDHKSGHKVNRMLPASAALRHYVGPVRHKMWQTSWKKVLG